MDRVVVVDHRVSPIRAHPIEVGTSGDEVRQERQSAGQADLLLTIARTALGAAGILLAAAADALDRVAPRAETSGSSPAAATARVVRDASLALLAAGLEAQRRTVSLSSVARRRVAPVLVFVGRQPLIGPIVDDLERRARIWAGRGAREQEENERLVRRLVDEAVGGMIAWLLDHIDLDEIAGRIDVARIVDRIDLDAVAARIDVNSFIDRVDLPKLTRQVLDEVDVAEIVRESTSSITTESVDALRHRGMSLDRGLSRAMDRMLLRERRRARTRDGSATQEEPLEIRP
ncbi:MAG: hypothetical protein E6G44_06380 [Actinobacteria bacterium]|nr:MAG: hypothetical protein E6G44_06380 [Actinomycetota bacterium]